MLASSMVIFIFKRQLNKETSHKFDFREHDKGPETFFQVLEALIDRGAKFQLSVLGQHYSEIPEIFTNSKTKLESRKDLCEILNWGYLSREDFVSVLSSAHVVVSTALHEFFGVSM